MKEISLHILDIAENGVAADASCIHIRVDEARKNNLLRVVIQDDGRGIPPEKIPELTDPFVTTRTSRRIGLGLSLLETAAQRCDGGVNIVSAPGKGTTITATFRYDHIDRAPLGDMAATISSLIAGNPEIEFVYTHTIDGKTFTLDTQETRKTLSGFSSADPKFAKSLAQFVNQSLDNLNRSSA